jgi:sulfur carrier protein
MRVTVNGTAREIPSGMTVRDLVVHLGLDGGPVAVEKNMEVVPRAQHAGAVLNEGDVVEIVHFVGGG